MLIAVLQNLSDAESLLDNLSEADFDMNRVSLFTNNLTQRNQVVDDTGPLKGATMATISEKLKQLGIKNLTTYVNEVKAGHVLVVLGIDASLEQTAIKMLQDYKPQFVYTV